ncbi:helix-turn-helix domain-containing protein [Streptomyces sp. NPDC004647]|uniref:helix-turn-helix domain-containing protein n=1 Tax=Streptomyces sp. NPDC004647 TaxID=3154671 RepID=UPI0033AAA0B8
MTSTGAVRGDRTDDLLTLSQLSNRPDAVRAILDWLARRAAGTVALLSADGGVLDPPRGGGRLSGTLLATAATAVADLHRRGARCAVLDGDGFDIMHVVSLDTAGKAHKAREATAAATVGAPPHAGDHAPYLVLISPAESRHGVLLDDTSRALNLCWRVEKAERTYSRIKFAENQRRDAVHRLLMAGDVSAARQVAATLGAQLPGVARVHVVECPTPYRRNEIAEQVVRSTHGRAWAVRCPVRRNHLVVLVPAGPDHGPDASADLLAESITEEFPECRVGVSGEVTLHETSTGQEQALHALGVARNTPTNYACFDGSTVLAPLLGSQGHRWAQELLRHCHTYTPARRSDPDAEELLTTLDAWLTFGSAAAKRQLKIHRNTLTARVHLLNDLLGLDLTRIDSQSATWLALRLHIAQRHRSPAGSGMTQLAVPLNLPRSADHASTLNRLLATGTAKLWARSQLRPLDRADLPAGVETVRAWLRADARLSATATTLGISLAGARKRLLRAEETLNCSLLQPPSAKYELWLAMRTLGAI